MGGSIADPLERAARERLYEDVQYLNLAEMRVFCQAHDLPLYIHIEWPDGSLRKTGDRDRKDIVLQRILEFASDGRRSGPTTYRKSVVSEEPLPARLTSRTRVHYGQYEEKNPHFVEKLKQLTNGAFRTGMIARLTLRDFWTADSAPALAQLARAWLRATEAHTRPRPEGAYRADLWRGEAGPGWKSIRKQKAARALAVLNRQVRKTGRRGRYVT